MQLIVHGAGVPELPLRLLNLLAQQGAIVERAALELVGGDYRIRLEIAPAGRGALIVEKIRAMVLVAEVSVAEFASV